MFMKSISILLFVLLGLTSLAQKHQTEIVPLNKLQQAANSFAQGKWGNVGSAQAIPYYDDSDNIIAYSFNYALGNDFPSKENLRAKSKGEGNNLSHEEQWGNGKYANLVMGNNLSRISMVRYINALSDEYALVDEIESMASEALGAKSPVLDKIYYYSPLLKYYKYDSNGSSVYVRIFPPKKVLSPTEFEEEYVSKFNIDSIIPKAEPGAWEYYLGEQNSLKSINSTVDIPHPEEVPYLDWSYGCSPTAGAMLLGYWDNYSKYSTINYSNLSKYHYDRWDGPQYESDWNVSSAQYWCAIYMDTDWSDGSTYISDISPGLIAAANSSNCGSYTFTSINYQYVIFGPFPNKLTNYTSQINEGRPCMVAIPGHSITGIGYETIGSNTMMRVHNTWNSGVDDHWNYTQMNYLNAIYPGGGYGTHIELTSPNGDPGYNHNGDGEILHAGYVFEITWDHENYAGAYCKLYYSTDNGSTWILIDGNTPNDGSYLWNVPGGLNSPAGRVKIEAYTSQGGLIGSDGSWGSFSFVNSGSMTLLESDWVVYTTTDPSYYYLLHPYSTWGVVGVRAATNYSGNWSMKMYTDNYFQTEAKSSAIATEVDFVVFDQHHLPIDYRGVKSYRAAGSGDGRVEFEGFNETLTVGTPSTFTWPAGKVVEIWDVYLTPGTYKFTMNYNSSGAYLDMALFSSGNGQYYQNRNEYIARSTEPYDGNELFLVTISNPDYYGLVVWDNDDASSSTATILAQLLTSTTWVGNVSTDWNTAANWSGNVVPTSTMDVTIPDGTFYSPFVNLAQAYAKTLSVLPGAQITIGNYDLDVYGDANIYGSIIMNSVGADLYCYADVTWKSGSYATMNANAEFHFYGDCTFDLGSNIWMNNGTVWFSGINNSYINNNTQNCHFNNVICQKSASYIAMSSNTTKETTIEGDLTIYAGSTFGSFSDKNIILNGSLINNGGHFFFDSGSFKFGDNPAIDLKPNEGDYFNNLIVDVSTWLDLDNSWSDSLVVKGDLTIQGGILYSNGHTITVGGDWLNYVGTYGFSESNGDVIFNGTGAYQFCYGETFYNCIKSPDAAFLYFYGPTNITNAFFCNGFSWSTESMDINYLYLNSLGRYTANALSTAYIDHLDMGFNFLGIDFYGILAANGGQIYVGDVEEDGLYGTFDVHAATGLIDITQGTGASEYLDINGSLDITDGAMVLHGGLTCDIGYGGNAVLQMSGGVLDVQDVNITIYDMPNYSVTTNLTGGVIRTPKNFTVYDIYNPGGGTLEFYGSVNSYLTISNTASSIHNLHVNKTSGTVYCNTSTTKISNDVTIDGGVLNAPTTLYVGGDWTNNVGTAAFNEGTNTVYFYGGNTSQINTSETFYKLDVNKVNAPDMIQKVNTTIIVNNNFTIMSGNFRTQSNTVLDLNGNFTINSGAAFKLLDPQGTIYLAGNLTDNNPFITTTDGLYFGTNTTLILDGTTDQHLDVSATYVDFFNLTLNKSNSSTLYNHDGFRVSGNFNLLDGEWTNASPTPQYYLQGDFYISSSCVWTDDGGTLHFVENPNQTYQNDSPWALGCNIDINKTSANSVVQLNSNLNLENYKNITINKGTLSANGHLIRLADNIVIHNDATLTMDDDSELKIGYGAYLDIFNGGSLQILGSQNHEVVVHSDDVNYWELNCWPGGHIAAEWATFSDLNSDGFQIWTGGLVDTIHSFNHCTFLPGQPNGVLLTVNSSQNFTVNYAIFPSQGASSYNVRKIQNVGQVTFLNPQGSFAGESFDADPYNRINWSSDFQLSALIINYSCNGDNDGTIDLTPSGGTSPYSYLWTDGATTASRSNLGPGIYDVTVTDYYGLEFPNYYEIIEPPVLGVSFTSLSVSCYGGSNGSINANAYGGIAGYTFLWSTGATTSSITNLQMGTYLLTVVDNYDCTITGSHTISQPPEIAISNVTTNVSSNGGSDGTINVTVTGGNPPYNFEWSNSSTSEDISGLTAGFYTVGVADSNGCLKYETIVVTEPAGLDVQTINLPVGWSIMSTYIDPVYPLVDSVFAPVVVNTAIVKNGSGSVFWPAFGVNLIGNMTIGEGYQVKMNVAQTLAVIGTAVSPESTSISIPNGWSLLGYLRQVPGDAEVMMSPIVSNLAILKNGTGLVYWPSFGLNMIGNMQSGQGYQIKLLAASVLVYPANSVSSKSGIVYTMPTYYDCPFPTDNNMTLGIPEDVLNSFLTPGIEVGIFAPNGQLVGSGVYTGENMAVSLWGDDELSPETDGLIVGADFNIRIWDGQSEKSLSVDNWTEGDGRYEENDIQIVGKFSLVSMDETTFRLDQNVPNPFKTNTRISFFLPEESEITLTVFDILGNEIDVLARGSFPAGNHTVEMEGVKYATGSYFYRLIANDFVETKQMEVGR